MVIQNIYVRSSYINFIEVFLSNNLWYYIPSCIFVRYTRQHKLLRVIWSFNSLYLFLLLDLVTVNYNTYSWIVNTFCTFLLENYYNMCTKLKSRKVYNIAICKIVVRIPYENSLMTENKWQCLQISYAVVYLVRQKYWLRAAGLKIKLSISFNFSNYTKTTKWKCIKKLT
jgi:hypothetical protein